MDILNTKPPMINRGFYKDYKGKGALQAELLTYFAQHPEESL